MEQTRFDDSSVVAEPESLTFTTRKKWRFMPENSLDELTGKKTVKIFKGTTAVYFLLRDSFYGRNGKVVNKYHLVKVIPDEDLKMDLYSMELSADECEQLEKTGFSLWD